MDWDIIIAIGIILTVIISAISLILNYRKDKKRLSIRIYCWPRCKSDNVEPEIMVEVLNIGFKKIKINAPEIGVGLRKNIFFGIPIKNVLFTDNEATFPKELDEEERCVCGDEIKNIRDEINNKIKDFIIGKIYHVVKLYGMVEDNTGKLYQSRNKIRINIANKSGKLINTKNKNKRRKNQRGKNRPAIQDHGSRPN